MLSFVGVVTAAASIICGGGIIVNGDMVNSLEIFPALSVTLIFILLYVPCVKVLKVIVLSPFITLVGDAVAPVIVIVPSLSLEKV